MQFPGQESHQDVLVCYNSLDRSEHSLEIQSLGIVETFLSLDVHQMFITNPTSI